jgi:hypothetical protein
MDPFSLDHIFPLPPFALANRGIACNAVARLLAAQSSGRPHRALALRLSGATWTDSAPLRFILPYVVKEHHSRHSVGFSRQSREARAASRSFVRWRYGDLNPRPMACKATALATELYPRALQPPSADGQPDIEHPASIYRKGRRVEVESVDAPVPEGTGNTLRKEVIQPHLPVRLPCYDFTPLTRHTFGSAPLAVRQLTSGTPNSGGVTGGVYKARERIHRAMLMRDY